MNGEGSIELKSWLVSRSFRLMVWVPSVRRSSFREPKTHAKISSIFGFEGQARFRDYADALYVPDRYSSSDRSSVSFGA